MSDPAGRARVSIVQLIPNMVTLAGMSLGITSIRFAIDERFSVAAFLILMATVFDGLDGVLARRLRASSELGAQLDSLADFVSFGVAPAVLVYHFLLAPLPGLGWVFALLFAAASALRLARFNVQSGQADADDADKRYFTGVPAPVAALLGLLPVFLVLAGLDALGNWPLPVALWLGLVALLMVSTLKTISPKAMRVRPGQVVFVFVLTVAVVGLTLTRPWLLLVILDLAYLAYIGLAVARARGRILG
ncbi:CDP-diacylglycerol--serine O-phosphatidyltransferase [Maritimibacter sp. HL-12]|uniref:CDP-diacylglycerol--serine O-phosphatidyltransferase n=1 Tax=Maritimibacter sp. HL-12 TaxID=1162418 RepID=UPI000A0F150E|nr:CDP-diacylglycerol--serine O-phosphatidyltransferase [Maritimibacter sp. HL-12]SMH29606.1 CDP-diacylglycerol---serine O-phosphatidyltransferase [Maritimibacter sp. HL-12]